MRRVRSLLAVLGITSGACGGVSVDQPQTVEARRFEKVSYPPPAALVEVVPPPPADDAVWLDGTWLWRFGRWVWQRGGWVEPPPHATYARWEVRYAPDGTLFFAPSTWLDSRGRVIEGPDTTKPANPPASELIPAQATPP